MRFGRALALVVGLAGAEGVGGGVAHAYVRSTTTATGHALYWSNPSTIAVDVFVADPPVYLDRDTLIRGVTAAAATWSTPAAGCTNLSLSVRAVDDREAPVANDMTNRITFRHDEWRRIPCDPAVDDDCSPYSPGAIAVTSVFARTSDGRILGSDMELNAVNFVWADVVKDGLDLPDMDRQLHDLQNVMTHELGHLIGLNHNCYDPSVDPRRPDDHLGNPVPDCEGASFSVRAATMYNSATRRDVSKRDLTEDDRQAVCEVYPVGSPIDGAAGGCAVTSPSSRRPRRDVGGLLSALAAALGVALVRLRRRRH